MVGSSVLTEMLLASYWQRFLHNDVLFVGRS